jgi:hypothetical protein
MTTKEALHLLINELPEAALPAAERYLKALRDDPVALTLLTAPLDDEPETPEEAAAVQEAREAAARGELFTLEEVRQKVERILSRGRACRD